MNVTHTNLMRILRSPKFYLLVLGLLMLLCALGSVKLWTLIQFEPSKDIPSLARIIILTVGIVLLFTSLSLHIDLTKRLAKILLWIYFCISIVFLGAIAIPEIKRLSDDRLKQMVHQWGFISGNANLFEVEVLGDRISKGDREKRLLLLCRKESSQTPFEGDKRIIKSQTFTVQTPMVKLGVDVSMLGVTLGDVVTCAVCLVPESVSVVSIETLSKLTEVGGIKLVEVGDHVK